MTRVAIFEEVDEGLLQDEVNRFLASGRKVVDIKYQKHSCHGEFRSTYSATVIYEVE